MKVWIFGDSFAEIRQGIEHQWQARLAKHLQCEVANVFSNGASSEYLSLKISEFYKDFKKNDHVIVFIPYWDRQCFFPKDPDLTHIYTLDKYGIDKHVTEKWNNYSKEQRNAFRDYFLYLHNEDLVKLKTASLYAWINNISDLTQQKPLIINTRDQKFSKPEGNYVEAIGTLYDVSVNEWKDLQLWKKITEKGLFDDQRISHLTPFNHGILSNKILDYIRNGDKVDLTTGFKKYFLDKNYENNKLIMDNKLLVEEM